MKRMLHGYQYLLVCDLLKYGFPIEIDSNLELAKSCKVKNHKGAKVFREKINAFLKKEASYGAIIGPFSECPFEEGMVISPLNTVPKSTPNERRIILDLSFPKDGTGVNDFVSKQWYLDNPVELVYPKIDDFVALIKAKGPGCLLYKLDLRRAYRQINICPSSYNLVGYRWKNQIFFDTVLSMGLRSAAHICQRVTNAFTFMMHNSGLAVLNYLDDFAGAENGDVAMFAFKLLREMFIKSGIEEAVEKACPPTETMTFLGILFNSTEMTMEVTKDRLLEIKLLIKEWLNKKSASLKDIQKLLGKLNFVGSCVRSSRIFINRILNWLRDCYQGSRGEMFIIPIEVQKDMIWWDVFLPFYNGISLIDYGEWSEADSVFSSDSCLTGCGGICGNKFFHSSFPEFIIGNKLSITCLEMLTVVVSLKMWCSELSRKKVVIFCDNMATCIIINTGKSRNTFLQQSLREICFIASVHDIQIKAVHLDSKANRVADCLSRWHLNTSFREEFYKHVVYIPDLVECEVNEGCFRFQHDW